ncbi:MAG: hypothetical protein IKQ60_03945 [Candidatus Methanomethylophilaceae archaeon]|nr:hypothetical protein [Candidatus Methanomethylophilaceae archaeon]
MIRLLDNILAVGSKDRWRVLEITRRNRAAIGSFGIPIPDKFIEARDGAYIPESVLEEVRSDLE